MTKSYSKQTTGTREQTTYLLTGRENDGRSESTVQYVQNEGETMEIYGYRRSVFLTTVSWICIVFTLGFLRLVFHWKPEYMLYCTHRRCNLGCAKKVLFVQIYKKYKEYFVTPVVVVSSNSNSSNLCENGFPMHSPSEPSGSKILIPSYDGPIREVESVRACMFKNVKYIWDEDRRKWYPVTGIDKNIKLGEIHECRGLTEGEQNQRKFIFGLNLIHVPVGSIFGLLFAEALNPFYVFQLFSVCLWFSDEYYYYAATIVIISAFGLTTTIIQTRKNQQALRDTIQSRDTVEVCRAGPDSAKFELISSENLIPGDIISLPTRGCIMHCDAILLNGTCIVNESMLTGESVPVTKVALNRYPENEHYSPKDHVRNTLFCGTQVMQTRYYDGQKVLALVTRTGFLTSKGKLVRAIMYPQPIDFKFTTDSYKFIGVLAIIAGIGFTYTVVQQALDGETVGTILLDSLDLITIVIPPALPMAMTIGILFAAARLKKKNIYCISPKNINISGSVNVVCFDKTGTLTEDGLDMFGVVPVRDGTFGAVAYNVDSLRIADSLVHTLAACHSLTRVDGELIGDPLDLKMFDWTNWLLVEPEGDDTIRFDQIIPTIVKPQQSGLEGKLGLEIGIVRQFPFNSAQARMSVIVREISSDRFELLVKGAPEIIRSLSISSTVPEDFERTLEEYTSKGYRVLGLAMRPLENMSYTMIQRVTREEIEKELIFLGLLVLENRLKAATTGILNELQNAHIKTTMITGDNMLTAISVAKECQLILPGHDLFTCEVSITSSNMLMVHYSHSGHQINKDEVISVNNGYSRPYQIAISGDSLSIIREHPSYESQELLEKLAIKCAVYARMSPEHKQHVIEDLKSLGYYVGMCGDGANDCGALKAAHAGISLSNTEASVASPFTARHADISCVPELIREGRAALVTSFGVFKYMALYSLIQFISVMILYEIDSNLSDFQFLYIDLFLITVFATCFGYTEAYPGPLVKHAPPASLISLTPLLSIITQVVVVFSFQFYSFMMIKEQPWFVAFNDTDLYRESKYACHENYIVFAVSVFQYIIMAIVYSKGSPYRKSIYSNKVFTACLIGLTLLSLWLVVYPLNWMSYFMELRLPPDIAFRFIVLLISFVNFVVSVVLEHVIIDYIVFKKCKKKKKVSNKRYKILEKRLSKWRPVDILINDTNKEKNNK